MGSGRWSTDVYDAAARFRSATGASAFAYSDGGAALVGAWGCGVFGNDPAVVATVFARLLQPPADFDQVVFAVHDRQPGTPVHRAFSDILTMNTTPA